MGWLKITQSLEGPFSAVSKLIFENKSIISYFALLVLSRSTRVARVCTAPDATFAAFRIISHTFAEFVGFVTFRLQFTNIGCFLVESPRTFGGIAGNAK